MKRQRAEYQKLAVAQLQHRLVFDALQQRDSARVEMLMREHAWVGFRYGALLGACWPTRLRLKPRLSVGRVASVRGAAGPACACGAGARRQPGRAMRIRPWAW